jgi:hypothetical protein
MFNSLAPADEYIRLPGKISLTHQDSLDIPLTKSAKQTKMNPRGSVT